MRADRRSQSIGLVKRSRAVAGPWRRLLAGLAIAAGPGVAGAAQTLPVTAPVPAASPSVGYADPWTDDLGGLLDTLWDLYGCSSPSGTGTATDLAVHLIECFDANGTPAGMSDADRQVARDTIELSYCMVKRDTTHFTNISKAVFKSTLKVMYLGVNGNPLLLDLRCS